MATGRAMPPGANKKVGPLPGSAEHMNKSARPMPPKTGEKRKLPDGKTYIFNGKEWVLDLETKPDDMSDGAWTVLQNRRNFQKNKDAEGVYGAGLPEYAPPPADPASPPDTQSAVNLPAYTPPVISFAPGTPEAYKDEVYRKHAEAHRLGKGGSLAFRPGQAQPMQPPSAGTPYNPLAGYGTHMDGTEKGMTANIIDRDGDGIDDRFQPGPTPPGARHWRR
jgi:hypothetical protein